MSLAPITLTTDKSIAIIENTRLKYSQDERGKQVDITVISDDGSTPYDLSGKKIVFTEIKQGGKIIVDGSSDHFIRSPENDKIGCFTYKLIDEVFQQSGEAHFQLITDLEHIDTTIDFYIKINSDTQLKSDNYSYISSLVDLETEIKANDVLKTSTFNSRMDQEKTARTNVDNDILQKFSNLLTSTSGKETNSAPEIKDARLGSSLVRGLSYDTLGNGIRDQFNKLFELLISNEDVQNGRISRMNYSDLVDRFNLLSNLFYDSSQLYEEPLLDIDGVQIEAENGDLISAETPGLKTDTDLSQLLGILTESESFQNGRISRMNYNSLVDRFNLLSNLFYDSSQLYEEPLLDIDGVQIEAENGDLISAETLKLKTDTDLSQSLGAPAGGDMLLSQVPSQPFDFDADKGTDLGLILKPTGDNSFDSKMVESPSIIWDDAKNKYIMVFTAYNSNSVGSIGYAFSTDLKKWEIQGQLFKNSGNAANGDKNGCTGPCLVKYDGIYYLFYLGLNGEGYEGWPINLCLATSTDLATWTYKGIVIAPSKDIPWISNTIFHPDVMRVSGYWYIFFNANGNVDGQWAERTGFAFSKKIDGPYTVDPDRISKFAEDAGDHSGILCGDPSIFKINDLYYMFYFDTSHKSEVVDRYAWTTAAEFPRGWRYGGPVIKNDKNYNKTFAHKPFVLIKDNILYHYYTAVGDQGRCIALQTFDLKSEK